MWVTDLWGVGHGFAGAVVACSVEMHRFCSWVSLLWLCRPGRGLCGWVCALGAGVLCYRCRQLGGAISGIRAKIAQHRSLASPTFLLCRCNKLVSTTLHFLPYWVRDDVRPMHSGMHVVFIPFEKSPSDQGSSNRIFPVKRSYLGSCLEQSA